MDSEDDHGEVSVKDALDAIRKDIEGLRKKKDSEDRRFHLLTNKIDPGGNVIDLKIERSTQQSSPEEKRHSDDEQFSKILEKNISSRLDKDEKIEEIINYFLHKVLGVWLNRTLSGSLDRLLKNEANPVVLASKDNFDETTAEDSISDSDGKEDIEIIQLTNIVKNDFV